jgi:hypothetical protein
MYESNKGSIKAYCKGGWFIETSLPRHYQIGEHLEDRVIVSCLNPKCYPIAALQQGIPPAVIERGPSSFRLIDTNARQSPTMLVGDAVCSAHYEFREGKHIAQMRVVVRDDPYRIFAEILSDPPAETVSKMIAAIGDCFAVKSVSIPSFADLRLDVPNSEHVVINGGAMLRCTFEH